MKQLPHLILKPHIHLLACLMATLTVHFLLGWRNVPPHEDKCGRDVSCLEFLFE